jgi:hypothetical protein
VTIISILDLSTVSLVYPYIYGIYDKKSDTLHERLKVVDSLPGYTSGMAGCRHNLVTRTTCSMRLSVSTDGTIRPLQRPLVGDCSLKRL